MINLLYYSKINFRSKVYLKSYLKYLETASFIQNSFLTEG